MVWVIPWGVIPFVSIFAETRYHASARCEGFSLQLIPIWGWSLMRLHQYSHYLPKKLVTICCSIVQQVRDMGLSVTVHVFKSTVQLFRAQVWAWVCMSWEPYTVQLVRDIGLSMIVHEFKSPTSPKKGKRINPLPTNDTFSNMFWLI